DLRRERSHGAVEVRAKGSSVLVDPPEVGQAQDLKPTTVGEDGARPTRETMEPAARLDEPRSRPEPEVIGVPQDALRAMLTQFGRGEPLDRALRPNRHEDRRGDDPMTGREEPRTGIGCAIDRHGLKREPLITGGRR